MKALYTLAMIFLAFSICSPILSPAHATEVVAVVREVTTGSTGREVLVYSINDPANASIPSPGFPVSTDDVIETGSSGKVVLLLDNFRLSTIGPNQKWRYQVPAARIPNI